MDTKWKNKIMIFGLIVLLTIGVSGVVSLVNFSGNYIHKDYFHTPAFQSKLDEFAGYLNFFELNKISLEEAKKSIHVTQTEIEEHRTRYGALTDQVENIKQQYKSSIQGALDADNQEAADVFRAERDALINDIVKNFKDDTHVEKKIMKEKEQQLEGYYQELAHYRSEYQTYTDAFVYYLKNRETGKIKTNVNETKIESQASLLKEKDLLYVTDYQIEGDYYWNSHYPFAAITSMIEFEPNNNFKGKIGIPSDLSADNPIKIAYDNYQQKQLLFWIYVITALASLVFCAIYYKKSKHITVELDKWKPYYRKIPLDIRIALVLLSILFSFFAINMINQQIFYVFDYFTAYVMDVVSWILITSTLFLITIIQCKYLIEDMKNVEYVKAEWKNAYVRKIIRSVQDVFIHLKTGTQFFLLLAVVFGSGLGAVFTFRAPGLSVAYLIFLIVIGLPVFLNLIKKIGYFNRIVNKTDEIASGKLGSDLKVKGKSPMAQLAKNINVLKHGVKTSQNEQAKSERLKTELITNVSHDLRTPLTSIITYTELLKSDDVSGDEKRAYVEVIDRKSKRLKLLIDDLFEVSKMASGNMEITKEKVDLVQLLKQSLGEYNEMIDASSLQFRITNEEKPIYAYVDGQKLWRVFENLISNILKYGMDSTRVYIDISTVDEKAVITFKNISKFELNDSSDELFERFKRADASRHTEGSGLGLAIAKSIIDLHDGRLDINTDGDLFKVSIVLQQA
ncbi:Sensor protein kinase WalK [Paraliobacillus sp. PM-2]|uniref:sensor histidine kinase n=1 Tax=Paraliobacillus sp. PM-2 TaxID=1462524 RepID=UPI00061BDDDD|nr:HAMP domain-containing sensor histidine kinase [Paraliobacillus sp. PM-2]CQR47427.1 Sensor protein kinase WalK [Paraliobacillus sp. PM-2]